MYISLVFFSVAREHNGAAILKQSVFKNFKVNILLSFSRTLKLQTALIMPNMTQQATKTKKVPSIPRCHPARESHLSASSYYKSSASNTGLSKMAGF